MGGSRFLAGMLILGASCAGCHMGLVGVVGGASSSERMYRAGTIANDLGDASVRTLGCLDIGLAIVDREDSSLLELHIGNRCSHPEPLDFAQIRIEGLDADGEARPVRLEDPRHEIVMVHVGAGERGKELIRLAPSARLVQLTFDVDAIAPDAPNVHPSKMSFARWNSTGQWLAVNP